jgi:hypothetical protein
MSSRLNKKQNTTPDPLSPRGRGVPEGRGEGSPQARGRRT